MLGMLWSISFGIYSILKNLSFLYFSKNVNLNEERQLVTLGIFYKSYCMVFSTIHFKYVKSSYQSLSKKETKDR
jgi:hypothetical protein